jgi:membrane peptidoglycan carboxypeptidase
MHAYHRAYAESLSRVTLRIPAVRRSDYSPARRFGLKRSLKDLRRLLFKVALAGAAGVLVVFLSVRSHYENRAAQMNLTGYDAFSQRNELCDAAGNIIRCLPTMEGGSTRKCSTRADLPQALVDALTSVEDVDFYKHDGINWRGVRRAAWHDLTTFSLDQGGSSITQQSTKLWLERGKESASEKLDRKALEMSLAGRIERSHTKDEILANYLNRLDFGAGLHGIYAAALGFFGKEPKDLSVVECATLVALVRSPTLYSPVNQPARCIARRNLVLRRMVEEDKLDAFVSAELSAEPLTVKLAEWRKKQVPDAITNMAMEELRRLFPEERIQQGGLKIALTIDWDWQNKAEEIAENHLREIQARRGMSTRPLQTAIVAVDNESGAVRVLVPGKPSGGGQLNRVTQSKLTHGSTAKPFGYLAAFERGVSPSNSVSTAPLQPGEMSIGPSWYSPGNVGDPPLSVTVEAALAKSINTSACRIGERAGFDNVAAIYDRLGICRANELPRSPTAYLGAFGVTPMKLAAAYTVFANEGPQCGEPHIIASVFDANGAVLYTAPELTRPGCNSKACRKAVQCLMAAKEYGTSHRAKALGAPDDAFGKTGTSDDCKDLWFAGCTKTHSMVVWIGCDKPQKVLNAYAGELALPLWVAIARYYKPL